MAAGVTRRLEFLDQPTRNLFFTGKGGVGKSAVVWGTATALAARGKKVRVAAWAPFHDLPVPAASGRLSIPFSRLETLSCFKEYALRMVRFEALYGAVFENRVLQSFLLAAPGLAETVVAGKIWDLVESREQEVLLVDLPASGHALSFFRSPLGILKVFPTGFVHRESEKVIRLFAEERCRMHIVTLAEELPMRESAELVTGLGELHAFRFGSLLVNQTLPKDLALPERPDVFDADTRASLERFARRRGQEKDALDFAEGLPLTPVLLPFFPPKPNDSGNELAEFDDIVENLAKFLDRRPEGA